MMIEKIVLDYLNRIIPTYMEMPEKYPAHPFAILEKTGGSESETIKTATIAVQSYGKTMLEAAQTNETVKETIQDIIELDEITRVELNSDYNYTDTATKRYRYQAVFDFTYY